MKKHSFHNWILLRFKRKNKYVRNRFGSLARNLYHILSANPFDENFDDYDTLEKWLEHLDLHVAPEPVIETMIDAWDMYESENVAAEIDAIRGNEDEIF